MKLRRTTKVIYGAGDWSLSSFNTLRQIFYAVFLTDVVGIAPGIASFAAVAGIVWDAINDPLMGKLSDRVRTRWGRRRPFLLYGAVPFALAFVALWWAPPWESQWALALHVTLAYILSDTLQTVVSVPYYALTPELTPDYDERTSLTAWRMFFNMGSSLAVAILAPEIVDTTVAAGFTEQQGYLVVASLFGALAVVPLWMIVAFVRERPPAESIDPPSLSETVRATWQNVPFRYLSVLYMLNWITFDLVGLMLPFFVKWQVAQGDASAKVHLGGASIAMESVFLGSMLVVAVLALPLWTALARRWGKRWAYMSATGSWIVVQLALLAVMPGDVALGIGLAALAGVSVAAAHVLPEAMIPDVVDVDELQTGHRNEGVYYGAKNLLRKITGAVAIFVALQVLSWTGYEPSSAGHVAEQPEAAMLAIRLLTGPGGAVLLVLATLVAWRYPLTRARHAQVRAELAARRDQGLGGGGNDATKAS